MSTATTSNTAAQSTTFTPATSETRHMSQYWWLLALRGLIGIIFGTIAFVMPVATMIALVLVFAAYMLVDAGFTFYAAYQAARRGRKWGLMVLQGLLNLFVGAVAAVLPGLTAIAFVLMVAAWALVSGALQIAAAFRIDKGRWWLVFGGVVSLIWGILLIIAPLIGAVVLTWWMGAWAIVFGALMIAAAFRLRSQRAQHPPLSSAQPAE
jgi:uncharacterized membrane protein HdeD (DUF308 family)